MLEDEIRKIRIENDKLEKRKEELQAALEE